jgi:hypothetical protein
MRAFGECRFVVIGMRAGKELDAHVAAARWAVAQAGLFAQMAARPVLPLERFGGHRPEFGGRRLTP